MFLISNLGLEWSRLDTEWNPTLHETYGSKAANLVKLRNFDFPVPDGVCVSSATGAAEAVREISHALPPQADGPYAVRSSSLTEDSSSRSFPGIFNTVLGVSDHEALQRALRRVGTPPNASLLSAYAELPAAIDRIPVIIQTIPRTITAGVLFTRHPVTHTDVIFINASWGLGKPVVDGTIEPDEFEIARTGTITEHISSEKHVAINQFGEKHVLAGEKAAASSLTPDQVLRLAQLARSVEAALGSPQDIEWLLDASNLFWLVQARPITT